MVGDTLHGCKDTVVFNVGGRCFEVFRHTIESRPSTLLANLLDDISFSDNGKPIFVDANPDRFAHVLDWYRYGEIYLSGDCALAAVLRDARYFMLSDVVTINGQKHAITGELRTLSHVTAHEVAKIATESVLAGWPTFEGYVSDTLDELKEELETFYNLQDDEREFEFAEGRGQHTYFYNNMCIATISKRDQTWTWLDVANLNCHFRLGVLLAELRRRGFECSVKAKYMSVLDADCAQDSEDCEDDEVLLRIGVRLDGGSGTGVPPTIEPVRVTLDGVNVSRGCLCVVK